MTDFFTRLYNLKPVDKKLQDMRAFAEKHGVPIMLADTERLLKTIVTLKQPKTILEIGTAIGYSGSIMLRCAKDARLYTIEMDEQMIALAKQNFAANGVKDRATVFQGDAREIVHKMTGQFDLVFLDGPKAQYVDFLPYIKKMMNDGGVLVADNVLFHGYVENLPPKKDRAYGMALNMNKFLNDLFADGDFESVILEVGDGISLSVKKQI